MVPDSVCFTSLTIFERSTRIVDLVTTTTTSTTTLLFTMLAKRNGEQYTISVYQ